LRLRRHTFARHARSMGRPVQRRTSGQPGAHGTCVICGTSCGCRPFFLTHGVQVPLCIVHRHGNYLRRDGGRSFANALRSYWRRNHGTVRPWCEAAAATHTLRVTGRTSTDGPGSYSWDGLRYQAEMRFADCEDPRLVIDDLRASHAGGPARAPSRRTMRRWFFEGRWLLDPLTQARRRDRRSARWIGTRHVSIESSALGMCIFRPTLAWALGIRLGDAVRDATDTAKARIDQVVRQRR
jgi:hypothetical protein